MPPVADDATRVESGKDCRVTARPPVADDAIRVESGTPATPPDVRRGYAPPYATQKALGLSPRFGLSPYEGLSPLFFLYTAARRSLASHPAA